MEYDIRVEFANAYAKAQKLIRQEAEIKLETVQILGRLHRRNAAVNLGMHFKDYINSLGLTLDQYYKRIAAYEVMRCEPKLSEMLRNGETHLTHLALVGRKITRANSQVIIEGIKGKSKREVEAFLSTVTPQGKLKEKEEVVEVRLKLTKDQLARLGRARDVLSARGKVPNETEVVLQALEDLIAKRDPMEKAKRSQARKEKKESTAPGPTPAPESADEVSTSRFVPVQTENGSKRGGAGTRRSTASAYAKFAPGPIQKRQRIACRTKHLVWLKYQGQCSYCDGAGKRCEETRMLEIDHILPVCRGGDNSYENLRLLCRAHNQQAAREVGIPLMSSRAT